MRNSKSGHVHDGFSEVEMVTNVVILNTHPEAQTYEQVFRDNPEVHLQLDLHAMDIHYDDCATTTKHQSLDANKYFPNSTFDKLSM